MATALGREVHALDPDLALFEVITLQEQVDRSTSPQQVAVILVGILGGLALLLAAIGLYGAMSYAVSQSTRELGLRMALGAGASNLMKLVLSRGLALTAGGLVLGAAVALGLTRLLELAIQSEPARPAGVRVGVCGDDDYGFGSEFFASLAGNAHRSGAGVAGLKRGARNLISIKRFFFRLRRVMRILSW
jgi:putative ABC transport system permease protein